MSENTKYRERYKRWFTQYYSRLYYYALQLVQDPELSKDLVSDAFCDLWNRIEVIEEDGVYSYLMRTVRNKIIDYSRHMQVHQIYTEYYLNTVSEVYEDSDEQLERERRVAEIVAKLPPQTRHILEECYVNRKKHREVAEELDVSQETIKRHVMKALKVLREAFNVKKE